MKWLHDRYICLILWSSWYRFLTYLSWKCRGICTSRIESADKAGSNSSCNYLNSSNNGIIRISVGLWVKWSTFYQLFPYSFRGKRHPEKTEQNTLRSKSSTCWFWVSKMVSFDSEFGAELIGAVFDWVIVLLSLLKLLVRVGLLRHLVRTTSKQSIWLLWNQYNWSSQNLTVTNVPILPEDLCRSSFQSRH